MIEVKILGTGCASCKTTQRLVEEIVAAKGVAARIEKVEDIASIMRFGVMSTPGVVIDGKVVHAGGVPSRAPVAQWIGD